MRHLQLICLMLSLITVSGCSVLQGGKLLAPESFGLTPVTSHIYVEAGADETLRIGLRAAMEMAESAVRTAYGGTASKPTVNACITERCYESFGGGRGSLAKVYGNRILLSPRALNWHFMAHEWSHAEMSNRLALYAWKRMPQWFDEGVAVAVSEAPEHAESHWKFLVAANVPRPTREELQTFKSLKQWLEAIHQYGEDKNFERKSNGEPEFRPVYAAAGHELRPWLATVGSTGLLAFINRMNQGADFDSAFQASDGLVERDASQASLSLRPSPSR
jgi:hypothetical protein